MWEILYGKSVSYNQEFGQRLQIEICCNDLRPTIIENKPQCYINLMKKCWEKDPVCRPSATKIREILTEWVNDENILLELTESDELLINVKSTHAQTYPDDLYRSKFISYTTSFTSFYQASELNELNINEKNIN
ncbi:hypothetical protein C2G38_2062742 [Gigaspora rosea]|uniref:Serine-threonine/tyrosine-protein kinase catalytic domain-containing protein n=1 Tax=Gigaspora rosea TaxID=44941 RepID=A0A397VXC4_9GLOM|nr:hypothetical protein C2G38_2062742 [Gigaspora rosea]